MTWSNHIHGGEQSDFGWTNDNVSVVLVKEETWTNPEAGEIRIGGIIGFVVSFHQGRDDPGLLIIQPWPHCLPGCLFLFPLQYHFLLPLNLLVCQDDCNRGWKRGNIKISYNSTHTFANTDVKAVKVRRKIKQKMSQIRLALNTRDHTP